MPFCHRLLHCPLRTRTSIGLRVFALCGVGDVGKTEVSREYTFSRRNCFDAVLWIEASFFRRCHRLDPDDGVVMGDGFAIDDFLWTVTTTGRPVATQRSREG